MFHKRISKTFIFSLIFLLLFSNLAFAHSGRTDSNGGHWDRKAGTYHYHNSGSSSGSSGSNSYETITPTYNYSIDIPSHIIEKYNAKEVELLELEQSLISAYNELINDIEILEIEYKEFEELEFDYLYDSNNYKSSYTRKYIYLPSAYSIEFYKNIYIKSSRSIYRDYESIWQLDLDYWERDLNNALKELNEYKAQYAKAKMELEERKGILIAHIEEENYKKRYDNAYKAKQLKVHYIDVGQGDSALIQLPNGQTALIDSGPSISGKMVVDYLKTQDVKKIDYVIATHPHEDHIGGLSEIIKTFEIDKIYMPNAINTTKTFEDLLLTIENKGKKIIIAKAGDSMLSEEFLKLSVLSPTEGVKHENLNEHSVVLKLEFKKKTFLFTGDMGNVSEKYILDNNKDIKIDVLKVAHHGSKSSTSKEFLTKLQPKYAVISCGKDNSYGHPYQETIDKLKAEKIELYRTDIDGTIISTSDGEKIKFDKKASQIKENAPPEKQDNIDTNKENISSKGTANTNPNSSTSTNNETTVYITKTGAKYHRIGCKYLSKSSISIKLNDAKSKGYTPCSVCKP